MTIFKIDKTQWWFGTAMVCAFVPLALLLDLIDAYWYSWLLLLIGFWGIIFLKRTALWQGKLKLWCWFWAIVIAWSGFFVFRPEGDVSLQGLVARESIRSLLELPSLKDNGFIEMEARNALKPSNWKAPKDYLQEKITVGKLPVEVIKPKDSPSKKAIYLLHGGAYRIALSDRYRDLAVHYSRISGGAAVVLIDYRVAPENVFPAALEDSLTGWQWLQDQGYKPSDVIVVGDSAGGNLALAFAETLRDQQKALPKAMVLLSPWADLAAEGASHRDKIYADPLFGQTPVEKENPGLKIGALYAGTTDLHDPLLSPVYADYKDFPPMLIQVGTFEVLESDSKTIYDKSKALGNKVTFTEYNGMFHGFQLFMNGLPESKAAWQEIEAYLQEMFR